MPLIQLRTYTLKTPSLAAAYAQRWKPTMASIAKLNIKTRGVYLSESNPKQVVAVVEFKDGDDPDTKVGEYANSPAFKEDLGEIDLNADFEGVEAQVLRPLGFVGEAR